MRKIRYTAIILFFLYLLPGALLITGCRKDDDDDSRKIENREFYKIMFDWYYWYDQMPQVNPDMYRSPYEVLEALRYRPLDRWSYVTTKEEFDAYYLESRFIGYGFGSAWDQDNNLRVTFIFNSVALYEQGVRRSWIIERINGVRVQPGANINQMLGPNETGVTNTFLFRKPDNSQVGITLAKQEVFMNTVLHKEVIEQSGRKIGYLVFKGFTTPSFRELEEAVIFFNNEGIDDLILDLRYNGGGQTNVANFLASIIGAENVAGKPFAKYIYNEKRKDANLTDNFAQEPLSLPVDRLITISTRATASASEMVINGLKPFMPVYIIGDNTYGKPMGMNVWFWEEEYAFVPVTFKIANAEGAGDYFDGLQANSYVIDDITRPFGDRGEASLKEALDFIETGVFSGLPRKKSSVVQPFEHMTGLRAEIGAH